MVSKIKEVYTLSLHDMLDKLGIKAVRVLELKIVDLFPDWDAPTIEITVLVEDDD